MDTLLRKYHSQLTSALATTSSSRPNQRRHLLSIDATILNGCLVYSIADTASAHIVYNTVIRDITGF